MILEMLGSTLLGLLTALTAARRLPRWFPHRPLTLATGPVAGLLGGLISRVVLGPGHLAVDLVVAVAVSAALLSLLVRPATGSRTAPGALPLEGVRHPRAHAEPA